MGAAPTARRKFSFSLLHIPPHVPELSFSGRGGFFIYVLHHLCHFRSQDFDDMLFQPGDIALGNAQHICYLLLRIFLPAIQAKSQLHYLLFRVRQIFHGLDENLLIHLFLYIEA